MTGGRKSATLPLIVIVKGNMTTQDHCTRPLGILTMSGATMGAEVTPQREDSTRLRQNPTPRECRRTIDITALNVQSEAKVGGPRESGAGSRSWYFKNRSQKRSSRGAPT
eukprot:Opistho-2@29607